MNLIQIRQAKNESNDIQLICKIHNESFLYCINNFGMEFGYKKIQNKEVKNWLENKNSIVLLAFYKNKAVGYTHCQIDYIMGEKEKITNFVFVETMESLGQSKIVVIPENQRK